MDLVHDDVGGVGKHRIGYQPTKQDSSGHKAALGVFGGRVVAANGVTDYPTNLIQIPK